MVRKGIIGLCAALTIVLAMPAGASAQVTNQNLQDILDQLGIGDLSQLGGLGDLQDLLDQLNGGTGTPTQPTATQPSGPPRNFIEAGIARHKAFYANAALTPEQRRANLPEPEVEFRLPIVYVLPALANILADLVPGLDWLADFFNGIILPPPDDDDDDVEPPAGVEDKGPVVFLTADDTTLTVGQETTVRVWVQQSSPNSQETNGIASVAVDVQPSLAGIISSDVPVTIVPPWDDALVEETGTTTAQGGIQGIGVALGPQADRDLGIGDPVQVFSFTVTAEAPGTVRLTATNFTGRGFAGVADWNSQQGNPREYVPVEITVTE